MFWTYLKYKDMSVFEPWNPREMRNDVNLQNHSLKACFKPYCDLCKQHTWFEKFGFWNPGGCSM